MVDKIKSQQNLQVQLAKEKNSSAGQKSVRPNELRESFKSLSSSISVAEKANESSTLKRKSAPQANNETKSASEDSVKLGSGLKDAVRISNDALSVLEGITTGVLTPNDKDLDSDKVNSLLSEESNSDPVEITESRAANIDTVRDLANDLNSLKKDLVNLFKVLQNEADKTAVYDENKLASTPDVEDVRKAQEMAESASEGIQFNPDKALAAYENLSVGNVSRLLSDNEDRMV